MGLSDDGSFIMVSASNRVPEGTQHFVIILGKLGLAQIDTIIDRTPMQYRMQYCMEPYAGQMQEVTVPKRFEVYVE